MIKKINLILIICISYLNTGCSQLNNCKISSKDYGDKKVYIEVDKMPFFKEGNHKILNFINTHLDQNKYNEFIGIVLIGFVVNKDGSLSNIEIRGKNKKKYNALEIDVIKAIKSMPKWNAGICGKKNVPVELSIPIRFRPN